MIELCVLSVIWLVVTSWMVHRGTPGDLAPAPAPLRKEPGKARVWRPDGPEATQRVRKRGGREAVILPLDRLSASVLLDMDSDLADCPSPFAARRRERKVEYFAEHETRSV